MKELLHVLIVDDEPLARDYLRTLLARQQGIGDISECRNGREAVRAIKRHSPDLVFLDVQMPEITGIDVINLIGPDEMPPVIFVTAYDVYAMDAFDLHALDYLLKPFNEDRFQRALEKARVWIDRLEADELKRRLTELVKSYVQTKSADLETTRFLERIAVRTAQKVSFVPVSEIDWIEAADYCVNLHCGGRVLTVREAMKVLEEKLDPRQFIRIHRNAIVNIAAIKEMQPHFGGKSIVLLHDGARLMVSRRRKDSIERILRGK